MDLGQFLGILRARWKFAIATVVLGSAATAMYLVLTAPQYGSDVKLFVSAPPSGGQADYAAAFILTQRIESYADLVTDSGTMQRVVDQLGLDESYESVRSKVSAEVIPSTQTVHVKVRSDTPESAQRIAEATGAEVVGLVERLEAPSGDEDPALVARVASEASISDDRVAPNIPLVLGVGILLSIFLAIAGAILRDLLDRTVKTRQDIEDVTGSAVLSTLPFEPEVKREPLITGHSGPLAEALRVLRTNLQFANLDANRQTILVSSAVPDEGKTLVATNLAISLAQSGRSVLLVDADMRNPNVAEMLGLENSVGLVTALVGRATLQAAIQEHPSGIAFMGTGPKPPNPVEVLETQAMRDLLATVRGKFDTVIIDAPPMLPVADASILTTEVDGALLLVRHGSTTREQLRLAVERLETVGGRLFGTILNRTPRRVAGAYGDGYGYGYGYGDIPEIAGTEPRRSPRASSRGQRRAVR
ncbi:polysaccharide biosynthesis tyrosine autokinase [Aeromicrobium sp. CTD01-1L150]|uniref:polysaccharide biosynthesis tyrosine autokinase n=1 Tax=Aeromicrobium sp. CTD01-1L150 TaxID=3341830 RepID=UPI0035C149A9